MSNYYLKQTSLEAVVSRARMGYGGSEMTAKLYTYKEHMTGLIGFWKFKLEEDSYLWSENNKQKVREFIVLLCENIIENNMGDGL